MPGGLGPTPPPASASLSGVWEREPDTPGQTWAKWIVGARFSDVPKHPQMTLYIHDDVREAVQEVADALHGNLSPTARHLLLLGLKAERARLGLPERDFRPSTKSRADAEAQGVQTRGQRDSEAARARRATGSAPAPARIRPRRPSDAPLPTRPASGGVWLPPGISQIDPISE